MPRPKKLIQMSEPAATELTNQDIVRAATNAPELSDNQVQLGSRVFTIVDLPYDDYEVFITLLEPVLKNIAGGLASRLTGSELSSLSTASVMKECFGNLPELARIVCKQTVPDITVAEIKTLAKTPFNLAGLVIAQINQNQIIKDVTDFFVQIVPLLTLGAKSQKASE